MEVNFRIRITLRKKDKRGIEHVKMVNKGYELLV